MLARPRIRNGVTRRDYACIAEPGRHGCGKNKVIAEGLEEAIGDGLVIEYGRLAKSGALAVEVADDGGVSIEAAAISSKLAALARKWGSGEFDDVQHDAASAALVERRGQLAALVRRDVARVPALLAEYAGDPDRLKSDWPSFSFDRQRAFVTAIVGDVVITSAPGKPHFEPGRLAASPWKVL